MPRQQSGLSVAHFGEFELNDWKKAMNPFQPTPMHFTARSPSWSDDVEMLQTDVMRFFAILCLCLMAIFALVKALPMASPVEAPTILEPTNLKSDSQVLQEEIAALKKKLSEAQTQVQSARIAAEKSSAQAQRAEKTEQALLARVVKARRDLEMVSQSLSDTQRNIEARESKLAKIVKDITDKRLIRAELSAQIHKEKQNLASIRTTLDQAEEKLARNLDRKQALKDSPPETMPQPAPSQKALSLRFASDAVLEALIVQGRVNFYAIAGQRAWQLKLPGGRPVYTSANSPREIYEMETPTVPSEYASAFHRQVAAFGRHTVTWGVTLPAETISSINQVIESGKGGDLVILTDGKVSVK